MDRIKELNGTYANEIHETLKTIDNVEDTM